MASNIDVGDLAQYFETNDIAECFDVSDIISDIADGISSRELARNIDLEELAGHVDFDAIADRLDLQCVADLVATTSLVVSSVSDARMKELEERLDVLSKQLLRVTDAMVTFGTSAMRLGGTEEFSIMKDGDPEFLRELDEIEAQTKREIAENNAKRGFGDLGWTVEEVPYITPSTDWL